MSDSRLVVYTRISPYHSTGRNHAIDTITIHHMAGDLSIETCGNIFQSREASSNYGIGSDGRIACYVHECDRSWCSCSSSNDNRSITVEIADCNKNWEISNKAMSSLINLLEDCCKRNDITKLVWSDNKSDRVHHKNGCNMTVHRDFASTTCPGDWLMGQMSYIANEVNKRLAKPINVEGVGQFIERLYNVVLDRASDPQGKEYWIDQAKQGASGADIAYGFFGSKEFLNRSKTMTDDDYVELLYQAFFGRNSDPIGKSYWVGLLDMGVKREIIIEGFIGSAEWNDLCKSYGIPPL